METSFLTALFCDEALSHFPVEVYSLNSLRCSSDQRQISLCNINPFSVREVMRIKDMITQHNWDSSSTPCTDMTAGIDVSASLFMHTPFPSLSRDSGSAMSCFPELSCLKPD